MLRESATRGGLRTGELCQVDRADVDLEHQDLMVSGVDKVDTNDLAPYLTGRYSILVVGF